MSGRDLEHTERALRRVAHILRLAHTAVSRATALPTMPGAGLERGMVALSGALGELRHETDDLAAADASAGTIEDADLRSVVTDMYVGQDAGRIGLLVRQIGDIAWARRSRGPLPDALRFRVRDLGDDCLALVGRAADVVELSAPRTVMDRQAEGIDRRQQELCRVLLSGGDSLAVRDAVDAAVLGRCYQECAQRAVAVARHVALLQETAPGR
ncbi:hypothetical protein ABZZ20_01435 [Streptomyces sp. NPDC006430]|uniref:hypothetical protein n=1 Tax=Streptomyces sp. NPDC006430 TaxID=3154299 RepID=UPI0033AB8A86